MEEANKMKNLFLALVMVLGVFAVTPANAQPTLRSHSATVGARGAGTYIYNNWYVCPAGSTAMYLNGGYTVLNRYVYPYGYTQVWVYAPRPGVYCVY